MDSFSAVTWFLLITLTIVAVWVQLKRTAQEPETHRERIECPRCGCAVSTRNLVCDSCGAPQQAYELVSSRTVTEEASPESATPDTLKATVLADICVGCGSCVPACPETGAIRMVGKQAIVDKERCSSHGSCVSACPVGGIVMSAGGASQRLEVPDLDLNFQSNVRGIYIVGELGGRGLIKNAINEGKLAVEHIATDSAKVRSNKTLDVLIIGAGPAGLSAGLESHTRGLSYVLLERGTLIDTIRKYPRHKLMLAEPVKVPLYGDLWIADASKETLIKVWERIIKDTGLQVRTGHCVEKIERGEGLFHVHAEGEQFRARNVILAMGRRGIPRRLGVPGEDLEKVVYDVIEMEIFSGRRVLVVGGGDSAVESAIGLSRQKGTEVTLSYRGEQFRRIKERNREKLEQSVQDGALRLLMNSQVRVIDDSSVALDIGGEEITLPNDDVIVRIGGEAPYGFLQNLGIAIVKKEVALAVSA